MYWYVQPGSVVKCTMQLFDLAVAGGDVTTRGHYRSRSTTSLQPIIPTYGTVGTTVSGASSIGSPTHKMLRLCALVVVASVGAAPPIPGSTKATWSMDILRRVRIVECGLAVAKSMGGASYRTTPALQTEWARRLDFDEADFEAITRVGGAGGPRMLWSVATLRSHAERNAWVQAQRRAHPYLRVLNATSKARPLADMVRHYDALGLRCEWRLSYGQIAWFLTYLRFLVQVLVADADYGMLLNDDVRGLCGNQPECRVHPIILH